MDALGSPCCSSMHHSLLLAAAPSYNKRVWTDLQYLKNARCSRRGRVIAGADVSKLPGNESVSDGSICEPKATFAAQRFESYLVEELQRPLAEYMSLPASQYSVLDAERIERVDDKTFRCYVQGLKFFSFEVRPVLLVCVEENPDGCCIRLLACTLEGSPIVEAQNKKFAASMVNKVSWTDSNHSPKIRKLLSDTRIEVTLSIPSAFQAVPVGIIETAGNQVLVQVLRVMLPRFLTQLGKDYRAWASGDGSRRPVGTGEI